MDVYLVRHAIADDRHPERWPDDALRPLTEAGAASFRKAARGLGRIAPDVNVVLSSPYTRAWETAEILHEEAGWATPEPCEALEAARPAAAVVEVLEELSDRPSVALVGHEPNLSRLTSLLACGGEDRLELEFKKGGVALLTLAGGRAVLRWTVSPKILRALGR
jgi:phosphohistidine phosphatase